MHITISAILITTMPTAVYNRQPDSLNSPFPETIEGLQRVHPPSLPAQRNQVIHYTFYLRKASCRVLTPFSICMR